jgi:uncharacterized membrane protein YqiK
MADIAGTLALIGIALFVAIVLATVYVATSRYKLAPANKILVVYGNTKGSGAAKCYHGGGKIVWPLVQNYAFLDLKPMTININLEHALSQQNIRINVPSTFTIGIDTKPSIMQNAAVRLLNLDQVSIEDMAKEIIFGQLRLTVASLTIEEINGDREAFLSLVVNNVDTELHKIGLYLINVNITDITDEADYIKSIGAKAAAQAIAAADVDRANATRDGAVGQAEADRTREIQVAKNRAESDKGQKEAEADRRVYVQQQESKAVEGENLSEPTSPATTLTSPKERPRPSSVLKLPSVWHKSKLRRHNTSLKANDFEPKKSLVKKSQSNRLRSLPKQKQNVSDASLKVKPTLPLRLTMLKQKVSEPFSKPRPKDTPSSLPALAAMRRLLLRC